MTRRFTCAISSFVIARFSGMSKVVWSGPTHEPFWTTLSEGLAQGLVQQVGCGMVTGDLRAPRSVDRGRRLVARADLTGHDGSEVSDQPIRRLLRVLDAHPPGGSADGPGVADLSTGLCVERSAFDEHLDRIAFACALDGLSVLAQRGDAAVGR